MRRESWLYILLGVLFVLYIAVEVYSPKPLDWSVSLSPNDKNPYGCYILDDQLPGLFESYDHSYLSLYELKDSSQQMLLLAEYIELDELDLKTLLKKVSSGQSALLAGFHFSDKLEDTLGFKVEYEPFDQIKPDTVQVLFETNSMSYSSSLFRSWFTDLDSSNAVLASKEGEKAILLSKKIGDGQLFLCASPLLFSNYALIQDERFAEHVLNLLPQSPTHYTQFYQSGKPQNTSTFRYILTAESLRWSLYLTVLLVLALLIINSQRKQRAIPILPRLENTTVHFIKTMAALFYRQNNHKQAALKLSNHFLMDMQRRFLIHPEFEEKYYSFLSKKTKTDRVEIIQLFEKIQFVQQSSSIDQDYLKQFYQDLNNINLKQYG